MKPLNPLRISLHFWRLHLFLSINLSVVSVSIIAVSVFSLLSKVDEEVRRAEHSYETSVRKVIREFKEKIKSKDQMMDRFCIRMLESDGKLYSQFFKTSNVLRRECLHFQYHRDYPEGLPNFFRDYSFREDIQDSSDDNIDAPPASDFYIDSTATSKSKTDWHMPQQKLESLMKTTGFDSDKVIKVMRQYPDASYEKLLEILTGVNGLKRPTGHHQSSHHQGHQSGHHRKSPSKSPHFRSATVQSIPLDISQIATNPNHVGPSRSTTFMDSPHLSPDTALNPVCCCIL